MSLTLSNIKPYPGSKKKRKRVGRGDSSGYGTYSGRGQKGQRARSGGKKKLKLKGLKPIIKRLPKIGGFKSIHKKPEIVNLDQLGEKFKDGETVDLKKMVDRGLIKKKNNKVKILGRGKLSKKLIVYANSFSKSAKKAIERTGGKAIVISESKPKQN